MAERTVCGLVTLVVRERWTPQRIQRPKARGVRLVCRSPRGDGCFALETIAMPADMDPFTVERLRGMAERSSQGSRRAAEARPFDEASWTADGVACVGRSLLLEGAIARLSAEDIERFARHAAKSLKVATDDMARYRSPVAKGPRIRRDWWLAHGTDMANAWYDSKADDAVAADLVDCEEMLRSIRFDSI